MACPCAITSTTCGCFGSSNDGTATGASRCWKRMRWIPNGARSCGCSGVDVTYALSVQAKGKVERPYRWLQDRIVRTCALEHITQLEEGRAVLHDELTRYNQHQVHSTTGEIP